MKLPNPLKQSILAIAIEPHFLAVTAWSRTWSGMKLLHCERVAVDLDPMPDMIVTTVRPLVLRWGLPPGTPVSVIVPPSIGGIVAGEAPRARKGTASDAEQELVKTLPFSLREIEWTTKTQRSNDQLTTRCFWLPKSWVTDLKVAFSRIGFRLDEIYPRCELLPHIEAKPKEKRDPNPVLGWVEAGGGRSYFHITRGSVAVSTRMLLANSPESLVREIKLEIATLAETRGFRVSALRSVDLPGTLQRALSAVGVPVIPVSADIPIADKPMRRQTATAADLRVVSALARAHKKGLAGFWIVPERDIVLRPLYELSLAVVSCALILCGILYAVTHSWERSNGRMQNESKKINPAYIQALAVEKEAMRMQHAIDCAEAIHNTVNPIDPLYRVYAALPTQAWIDYFAYNAGAVTFRGFGITPAELEERLKKTNHFSNIRIVDRPEAPSALGPSFDVQADWVKGTTVLPERPLLPLLPAVYKEVSSA